LALKLGVFRIGKTLPAGAQFSVAMQNTERFGLLPNSNDPQAPGSPTLSLFRRPLATTNTRLDVTVLWDGRQSINNLRKQVKAAAQTLMLGPDQNDPRTDSQADSAALLMTSVFTAQDVERGAGLLSILGAHGGARNLKDLATSPAAPCLPMTDPGQAGLGFIPAVPPSVGCTDPKRPFDLYAAWSRFPSRTGFASVARGEAIFNDSRFLFPGIPVKLACTTCHTTTNVGNFPSIAPAPAPTFVRYGLDSPEFLAQLPKLNPRMQKLVERTADLPVYTITISLPPDQVPTNCFPAFLPDLATGQPLPAALSHSTDLGRAMVTGLCADIGGFKPPILRGLASHAPYFHNGAAAEIEDVVNFYDTIFQAKFTDQERADLAAFLRSL
jgi:cytochrome c peroxidase